MGKSALHAAIQKGAPLVDVTVRFVEGIDYEAATLQLNSIADDLDFITQPRYDDPRSRIGSATKEALDRLFGWQLKRIPLPKYDELTKTWGHWPETYYWGEVVPVQRFPVEGVIASIGMTQPGADDDGQWYE